MAKILLAESDTEIAACFAVMQQLRPQLVESEFVARVQRQRQHCNYQLVCLQQDDVIAIAGFRLSESLAWGRFLYVDDLVTRDCDRSLGYGTILFDWVVAYARSHGCEQLHLDSGVQRFAAHRFYFTKRMEIASHHFSLKL